MFELLTIQIILKSLGFKGIKYKLCTLITIVSVMNLHVILTVWIVWVTNSKIYFKNTGRMLTLHSVEEDVGLGFGNITDIGS